MYLFELFNRFLRRFGVFFCINKIIFFIELDNQYIAAFYSNSYIKRPPLQPVEHTGKFTIEIWFLSESSSGRKILFFIKSVFKIEICLLRFINL